MGENPYPDFYIAIGINFAIIGEMFYHLVVIGSNNIIGAHDLPPWWYYKPGGPHFKIDVKNYTIIMSRKSFENFGYKIYMAKKVLQISHTTMPLEKALSDTQDEEVVFIAGGLSLYEQTMPFIQGISMIRILKDYKGDTYYPEIPADMHMQFSKPEEENIISHYYERQLQMELE